MRVHKLKCWPHFLDEIESERKTFDLRDGTDRIFQAGDQAQFVAYDPSRGEFVPIRHPVTMNITAVYSNLPGLQPGYVALQLRKP